MHSFLERERTYTACRNGTRLSTLRARDETTTAALRVRRQREATAKRFRAAERWPLSSAASAKATFPYAAGRGLVAA